MVKFSSFYLLGARKAQQASDEGKKKVKSFSSNSAQRDE